MGNLRIAFYAPMKPPDHPVPSGDRQMARLLIAALESVGHDVAVVSTLRSHSPAPDPDRWRDLETKATREIEAIAARWRRVGRPDLWFTYHNYYKAPDLIGPRLSHAFDLPYAIAEASHAARRAADWGPWAALADAATRQADLHVCFTGRDRAGIAGLLTSGTAVLDLPPFIDGRGSPPPAAPAARSGPPIILAVAMMRPGDKLRSYRFLADALARLPHLDWCLRVVGDGPARDDVATAFAGIPGNRVAFCGQLDTPQVAKEMARADILAWPGFAEAFGLAYLEGQFHGLPVVALDTAGVAAVVRHGETGLLVATPDSGDYATALETLLRDPERRRGIGAAAATWVRRERTLAAASRTLDDALSDLIPAKDRARVG